MLFNLVSLIIFIICFLIGKILVKFKYGSEVVRILSILMLCYKTAWYIVRNVNGQISIPVEISSISYFFVSIIIAFNITKINHLASFFGISAGLGFFLFYIFVGFTVINNFTLLEFLISNVTHGYLLMSGIYLFETNSFKSAKKLSIWTTILGMIVWALVFYDIGQVGITFIYYIIKPNYLFIFENLWSNILILVFFYLFIIFAFHLWIKCFYYINRKLQLKYKRVLIHQNINI